MKVILTIFKIIATIILFILKLAVKIIGYILLGILKAIMYVVAFVFMILPVNKYIRLAGVLLGLLITVSTGKSILDGTFSEQWYIWIASYGMMGMVLLIPLLVEKFVDGMDNLIENVKDKLSFSLV